MGILSRLRSGTNELHVITENKSYLVRYKKDELTLLDHYRHLSQLLLIYQAIEKKLKNQNFLPKLPVELAYLLNRSEEIKKDLKFLEPFIAKGKKDFFFKTTKSYEQYIDQMKINNEIFSHFLVRILGDLFGGQKIKGDVIRLYQRKGIFSEDHLEKGVHFYCFREKALGQFINWLNQQQLENESNLVDYGNDAFRQHIFIFDELEQTRVESGIQAEIEKKLIQLFQTQQYYCNFFKKAAAAGVAVVATSVVLTSFYSRMSG